MAIKYPNNSCWFIFLLIVLTYIGCEKDTSKKTTTPISQEAAPLQAPTPQVHNPETPKPKTTAAKIPRVKRDVLVGGCLATCEDPLRAARGFLRAALNKDLNGLRTHLNSATFVYNGVSHGEEWAEQYLQGDLASRRESIDKWLKRWVKWVDHIIDPADRRLVDDAIMVKEQNQRQLLIQYRPPDRASNSRHGVSEAQWLLTLKPRGLEWLVTEINEQPIKRSNQQDAKMR